MAVSTWTKGAVAAACWCQFAHPRMVGVRVALNPYAVACWLSLMTFRLSVRNAL